MGTYHGDIINARDIMGQSLPSADQTWLGNPRTKSMEVLLGISSYKMMDFQVLFVLDTLI